MSVAETIGAITAASGALGGGIAFVWKKVEERFTAIEKQLNECHARDRISQQRRGVQLTVIELLWQEVQRLAPDANVLRRAKRLLDELKHHNDEDEIEEPT